MGKLIAKLKTALANTDEGLVLSAKRAAFYRGRLVVKTPFDASASCGIIFLSRKQNDIQTLHHEYGHILQLKAMGFFRFLARVIVPSLMGNLLNRMGRISGGEYYGLPWEREADMLGGVQRRNRIEWEGRVDAKRLFGLLRRKRK